MRGEASPERTAWARNMAAPVRDFLGTEMGSAVALVGAAVVALAWANVSPSSYVDVWSTALSVEVGSHGIEASLREWVNQGLMALFFLVIGLEAKREFDLGELRERTRVWIPAAATFGGMAVAVGVFLAINGGGEGAGGWAVVMSTDTALGLGVLALVAPGGTRLRVFLLTAVVVDDLVALPVIVVAYTESIDLVALAVAAALFGALLALRFLPTMRGPLAVLLGIGIWVATFESGVDPIIVGLAVGLVTTAYPPARGDLERATDLTREFREQPTPGMASAARRSLAAAISPNERLQHALHPWTSYAIVPLFALANAGVHVTGDLLSRALTSPITLGIVAAYCLGKPIGFFAGPWIASRRALGGIRPTITWPGLLGTGAAAGVGFTVPFLIAALAFEGDQLAEAKLGILVAGLISSLISFAIFRGVRLLIPRGRRVEQLRNTADAIVDLAADVDPGRDHVRGDPDGMVTLVEYADFECPFCGKAEPTIRDLLARSEDFGLRYVFRHLPLNDVHPHAQLAAEAAEAAGAQDAFWPMHDLLLDHQGALNMADLLGYATELDLDVDRFEQDIRARRHNARVTEDVASADASGVSGTPSFFINGRRHRGVYDEEALLGAIQRARVLGESRGAARG